MLVILINRSVFKNKLKLFDIVSVRSKLKFDFLK